MYSLELDDVMEVGIILNDEKYHDLHRSKYFSGHQLQQKLLGESYRT
jgi:hypothetical protein